MDNSRLQAIDFGRGLSVLVMVCVHTLWMYGNEFAQSESWLGTTVHMLGKGTTAFLIAMGISLMLSRNQSPMLLAKRGLFILAIGYFMNTLKFVVPIEVFGTMPDNFIAAYGWQAPLTSGQLTYLVLTGDILQMAGFALLVLSLVTRFVKNKFGYLVVAAFIALISQEVRGARLGVDNIDYFLDVLWGEHYNIYFPLFPWLAPILVGMYLSKVYLEANSDNQIFITHSVKLGGILVAIGGLLMWHDFDYHFADFFHTGLGGIAYLTGLNLLALALISTLVSKFPMPKLSRGLAYLSRHVTSLYVIQWVLICWGMGLVGFMTLSTFDVILMMPVMLVLTLLVNESVVRLGSVVTNYSKKVKLA